MMYMLGEKYKQQSDLLTMALNIGLEVLKGNGDIEPKEITERAAKTEKPVHVPTHLRAESNL